MQASAVVQGGSGLPVLSLLIASLHGSRHAGECVSSHGAARVSPSLGGLHRPLRQGYAPSCWPSWMALHRSRSSPFVPASVPRRWSLGAVHPMTSPLHRHHRLATIPLIALALAAGSSAAANR